MAVNIKTGSSQKSLEEKRDKVRVEHTSYLNESHAREKEFLEKSQSGSLSVSGGHIKPLYPPKKRYIYSKASESALGSQYYNEIPEETTQRFEVPPVKPEMHRTT